MSGDDEFGFRDKHRPKYFSAFEEVEEDDNEILFSSSDEDR